MKTITLAAMVCMLILSGTAISQETEAEKKGHEIKVRQSNRDKGESLSRNLTMILIDNNGKERKRVIKGMKKYHDDHSKDVIMFIYPKNIKGTSLLTYDYKHDKEDNQWIYLPSARKVRRIPANRLSDYFMGSDFTFGDMKEEPQLEDYRYKLLGEEKYNDKQVYIVESIPKSKQHLEKTGYSRIVQWIEEESLIPVKSVYYDIHGDKWKQFTATVAHKQGLYTYKSIEMINEKRQHKTIFQFDDIVFNKTLSDSAYKKENMASAEQRIFNSVH